MIGGALQGLGMGIMQVAEQRREEALEKLRNERALDMYRAKREMDEEFAINRENRADARADDAAASAASAFSGKFNEDRSRYIRDKFIDLGYPEHVANGLVGNIMQESGPGIDTGAVGDNGASIGMGQWQKGRRKDLEAFAKERGTSWKDLDTQILFLDNELKTKEKAAYDAVMKTETAEEAAVVLSKKYWRPGKPHNSRRVSYAKKMAEIAFDPRQTPQARDMAAGELKNATGTKRAPELTGKTWVPQGDGTEVLMGRVGDSGTMQAYTNDSGKPISRKVTGSSKKGDTSVSSATTKRIYDWAQGEGLGEQQAATFVSEVSRLKASGMSEAAAWRDVLKYAKKGTEEVTNEPGMIAGFLGAEPTTETIDTGYTGDFSYPEGHAGYTAKPAQAPKAGQKTPQSNNGQGGAPAPAQSPGQSANPNPSNGIPQLGPNDKSKYDSLPSGTQFIGPDGITRVKP